MTSSEAIVRAIRKRAAVLDQRGNADAIERFAYPVDDNTIALANTDGLESTTPASATYVVSDPFEDRSRDEVNPFGIDTEHWAKNGAIWLFGHGDYSLPIGTSLHPQTGELCWWPEAKRVRATCWFDTSDSFVRTIIKKVARGLLKSTSIAFIPRRADRSSSGQGYAYQEVELTEISIVPISDNPRAMLESADIPPALAKSLRRVCRGGKCFSRWIPPPQPASLKAELLRRSKRLDAGISQMKAVAREIAENIAKPADSRGHQCEVLLSLLRAFHTTRKYLAENLPQIKAQESDFQNYVISHSAAIRESCHGIVAKLDELRGEMEKDIGAANYQRRDPNSPAIAEPNGRPRPSRKSMDDETVDTQEILARYAPEDMTPEEVDDLIDRYWLPGFGGGVDPNTRSRR